MVNNHVFVFNRTIIKNKKTFARNVPKDALRVLTPISANFSLSLLKINGVLDTLG
jgi:hypothetical protein